MPRNALSVNRFFAATIGAGGHSAPVRANTRAASQRRPGGIPRTIIATTSPSAASPPQA
jgi:hypothetical protein